MPMTISTIPGHTYIVSSPTEVTITTPTGVTIGHFPANVQSSFLAPSYEVFSDNDAAIIFLSEDSGTPTTADNNRYALQVDLDRTNALLARTREELAELRAQLNALQVSSSRGIISTIWNRVK